MFFSFDGVDGCGKTTQMGLFAEYLRSRGQDVITCRDPGSTPLGERVREIVLEHRTDTPIGARSEMFLYMAARAQLVESVIGPALAAGKTVVSDRFLLANVVYQGYAGGLDVETLWQIGQTATTGLTPDLIFVLDMAPAEAQRRIARALDRMERQDQDYRLRLRQGFLTEAKRRAEQIAVIDASGSIAEVQRRIRAAGDRCLKLGHPPPNTVQAG
ncbi:MAG: dTMP kinase [Planctomycetes bacterium RBG_16_64_10]|nr:MAG: dTMP kinase [Planctomycetes bacterium RBG_16_64_10]